MAWKFALNVVTARPAHSEKKEAQQAAQLARKFVEWKLLISAPEGSMLTVNNREFVLGLDKLYRDAMKGFNDG